MKIDQVKNKLSFWLAKHESHYLINLADFVHDNLLHT